MTLIQKPVYECDTCKKEMAEPFIETLDVVNEASSTIVCGGKIFDVGGQHYCSLQCLFADIRKSLDSTMVKNSECWPSSSEHDIIICSHRLHGHCTKFNKKCNNENKG